jgi:NitT/TauT family transport system substrate-binding protein
VTLPSESPPTAPPTGPDPRRRRRVAWGAAWALVVAIAAADAAEPPVVRVAALKFGTVSWELDVIREHALDRRHGVRVAVTELSAKSALSVALQGDAVDLIVNDWIWVARQRAAGHDYVYYPYSLAVGGLVARPGSGIASLADLEGRRLGIAGGPVDKSWLLLRAYGRKTLGRDLRELVEPAFAAPPLLNAMILKGDLDAALNFWHYQVRLEHAGMERVIDIATVLRGLGVDSALPLVGWVFDGGWARAHRDAIEGFLRASDAAKALLRDSDAEWERIRPLTRAEDPRMLELLRDAYRAGLPSPGADYRQAATEVFEVLAREGGAELVGEARSLDPEVFWRRP